MRPWGVDFKKSSTALGLASANNNAHRNNGRGDEHVFGGALGLIASEYG